MNPPPIPIIEAKIPTKKPMSTAGMELIYKLDARKRILRGRPCTQEWWRVFLIFIFLKALMKREEEALFLYEEELLGYNQT